MKLPNLSIEWNGRLSSTAGRALHDECRIELNTHLINHEGEPWHTIRHELAHLIAQELAGKRRIPSHGKEWQRVCAIFGLPKEKACHHLPLPRRKYSIRYRYKCPGCQLIINRVRKMARYSACLACCREFNGGHYHPDFQLEMVERIT